MTGPGRSAREDAEGDLRSESRRFEVHETSPDAFTPPTGNPRFPSVDGVRAFAALAALAYHADQATAAQHTAVGRFLAHGDCGVPVFFLITGFLLYRPYFAAAVGDAPKTPTPLFYWRRLVRIVPAYWVALLVLAPILTFAKPAGLPNLFFFQLYLSGYSRSGIPPAWSIDVEMSFYLLLPLCAMQLQKLWGGLSRPARQRYELRLLGALAVASIVFRALVAHLVPGHRGYVDPLPGTLLWFCAGMALAVISVEPAGKAMWVRRLAGRPWLCWILAVALYAATLTTLKDNEESIAVYVLYCGAATFLLLPVVIPGVREFAGARLLRTRPLAWLGLISYGIYLYHFPIIQQIHLHSGSTTLNLVLLALGGAVIAIACGAASYYCIERPALKLKRATAFSRIRMRAHVGA
jgi:peptidoglycan/LPS O-acetylase OafA/YrhL